MADEKANGELTEDELKADEYKLEANKYFKGKLKRSQTLFSLRSGELSTNMFVDLRNMCTQEGMNFTFPFCILAGRRFKNRTFRWQIVFDLDQ